MTAWTQRTWRLWAIVVLAAMVASGCARPIIALPDSGPAGSGDPEFNAPKRCAQPGPGQDVERVDPASVDLDPAATVDAVAYASARGAQSVRVYRRGCLVATSGLDPTNEWSPMVTWSMTKGIVSMIVGRAVTMGYLGVEDPIGDHLDGLDPAHAAITVRQLLTQTSGLRFAWANDLNAAAQLDSAALVLTRPFEAEPGTRFMYAQTTVTALIAVVEAAVGEDLQAFASRELFEPIGIEHSQWRWDRDGAGRSQGFAFLDMSPQALGRLGLVLADDGRFNDHQLIDADYMHQGTVGTDANPGYGFLWRTNRGERMRQFGYVDDDWLDRRWIRSAPPDTFAMSGLFNQNVIVIPSLEMVVVRMGWPNELFGDPMGLVEGERPAWSHRFFSILLHGLTDVDVADPVPWTPDPKRSVFDAEHLIGVGF